MNLNKCAFPAMVLLRQDGSVQVAGDTHYQSCVNHLTFIQRLAMKTAESCSKKKVKKVQASQCRPSQVNCLDLSLARQKQGSLNFAESQNISKQYGSNMRLAKHP